MERKAQKMVHVPSNLQIALGIDTVKEFPLPWTERRVREELPHVEVEVVVRTGRKTRLHKAILRGRELGYPAAHLLDEQGDITGENYLFSWAAIVHSLNTGEPLVA